MARKTQKHWTFSWTAEGIPITREQAKLIVQYNWLCALKEMAKEGLFDPNFADVEIIRPDIDLNENKRQIEAGTFEQWVSESTV